MARDVRSLCCHGRVCMLILYYIVLIPLFLYTLPEEPYDTVLFVSWVCAIPLLVVAPWPIYLYASMLHGRVLAKEHLQPHTS